MSVQSTGAGDAFPTSAREAVEALFEVHHRRLVGLASLLVDDRGSAEEIVQDAFESLFQRWNRLRDPAAAVAYLDRSVVYGGRTWVKRRVTARTFVPPPPGVASSPESEVLAHEQGSAVVEAVRALPRRQREVVVLRYFLDLSEAQIAEWLGISAGSVKKHQFRATEALKQRMEAWA
jgi:RNA polymerase sigma-70 factor (sigma-E family)